MNTVLMYITYIITSSALVVTIFVIGRFMWYGMHSKRLGKQTIALCATPEKPTHSILLIGDSTLYGTGCADQNNSIGGRIFADYPTCAITNLSENGMTLARLILKLHTIDLTPYDLVLIQVGGMDVLRLTPLWYVRKLLRKFGSHIRTSYTGPVLCVSVNNTGVPPLMHAPISHFFDRRSRRLTDIWRAFAQEYGFVHVPLYKKRHEDPLHTRRDTHFATDRMHPNDKGYGLWYSDIKVALDPYLRHG